MKKKKEKKEKNYRKIEKIKKKKKIKIEKKKKKIDKFEDINRLLIQEKEKNKKNYLEIEQLKIELNEEKEKNEKELKEYKNKNEINLEQLKLKTSQIDTFTKTLNEKDELIKKLRNNYMQNEEDKSSQYLKEIQELEEKNKNLLKENDELKQSNIILIKSSSPDLIKISQSKISEKLSGIYDITDKNEINDYDNNKEIINELKIENEKLKKQIEEFKLGKHEIKEEKENKHKALYQSDDSDFEEEFDDNYLANTAKKRNNSEDRRIDYQGFDGVNDKYEELKKKISEIKEIFKYIISKIKLNDPDLQPKINRVSELLNIDCD